jgi:hypothetical protein
MDLILEYPTSTVLPARELPSRYLSQVEQLSELQHAELVSAAEWVLLYDDWSPGSEQRQLEFVKWVTPRS